MQYISTRGASPAVSFTEAITQGLAPDGGLYVPRTWPRLDKSVLEAAATAPYFETAAIVLKAFAGDDLDIETARKLTKSAYGDNWGDKDIVPLRDLGNNLHLLELFHGPSLAFKDVAMQLIAELYEYFLNLSGKHLSVICATSGDTGGAAVEALKNKKNVSLFVMLPDGRVSEVQKRFMTASGAANVHALVLDGDFDKAQAILKNLFADYAFVAEVNLTPVNSVNFARIVAQCVYFITSAAKLGAAKPIDFIIPTGNFGDAFSAWVAKKLGANIGKIIIANNANNSIALALETGKFATGEHSIATISPAMDIQIASNFERIIYELSAGDAAQKAKSVNAAYSALKTEKSYIIEAHCLAALRTDFAACHIDDSATSAAIIDCKTQTGEIICPHTAVGWAARHCTGEGGKIILATAHPAKFPETVTEILGIVPSLPPQAVDLFQRPEHFEKMHANEANIKTYLRARS
ncbi:MAG: threonine synthase [Hyphomonadaceae bacterium]|nr:MAG: threonine synthase [Hyphomonadaceae bacterium]KAF0184999.1 MAG: threonine synthase [Hyphomonadaceae bacterium]